MRSKLLATTIKVLKANFEKCLPEKDETGEGVEDNEEWFHAGLQEHRHQKCYLEQPNEKLKKSK